MNSCVFVSIDDGTARNDFPNSGNIIKRGDAEVGAVHHFIKQVLASSEEDGASADAGAEAVGMEENDVTIGRWYGWKNVAECIQSFPITRHPKHVGLRKQQVERALDATPSPDDYLTTLETYTERSTGKKRRTYNSTPSTHSTEAAESFEAYDIETYGGVEYIKVFAGEGVILKDHEDVWRMLSTSYTPPKWGEPFLACHLMSACMSRRKASLSTWA